jgi:hypothetical protein
MCIFKNSTIIVYYMIGVQHHQAKNQTHICVSCSLIQCFLVYILSVRSFDLITLKWRNITIHICVFGFLLDGAEHLFQQYISYIVAVSFVGGGNQRTRRKPSTCRKLLSSNLLLFLLLFLSSSSSKCVNLCFRDRRICHPISVGFTTTYVISAYHHWCCEFESRSGRDVQHYPYWS